MLLVRPIGPVAAAKVAAISVMKVNDVDELTVNLFKKNTNSKPNARVWMHEITILNGAPADVTQCADGAAGWSYIPCETHICNTYTVLHFSLVASLSGCFVNSNNKAVRSNIRIVSITWF